MLSVILGDSKNGNDGLVKIIPYLTAKNTLSKIGDSIKGAVAKLNSLVIARPVAEFAV